MSGYIKLITGGVLTAIFVISILMFAVNFADDNDSDISIVDDGRYNLLNDTLREQMTNFSGESEDSQDYLFRTTLEPGDEHAGSGAQFKVGPFTAISMSISAFSTAFFSIFGVEFSFIAVAFASLIGIIVGYYTIKAWLGRSPD